MALSDLAVRKATATGKDRSIADFDGLYLFVPVQGRKAWHFRYYYVGKRERFSLGTYPEVSLREARDLRDEARILLAKGINPRSERKRKRQAIVLAGADTFMAVYKKWLAHRQLSLDECRQGSYEQIQRVFKANVFPVLDNLTVHEITQAHLLDIIGKVEARGSLSVAEKLRTWLNQLFSYIKVVVTGIKENPATDLDVVALPLPPVDHNPFLRMAELPVMLQTLRKYRGRLTTQLGLRLLMLTGVRTGELRFATPDQFDLDRGLWIIPVVRLKQRKMLTKKKRKRMSDIPPYIVPLSVQAQEIVRYLLSQFKPAQVYLLPGARSLLRPVSENTLNHALKRMGYEDRLTGHGIRATISTALNELGYLKKWVDAQLSHADPDRISATYNHAEYVEQRRVMMQDWADRLDLFEQNHVQAASMHLTITLQGLPTIAGQAVTHPPIINPNTPTLIVAPATPDMPIVPESAQRLPAVEVPDYAKPQPSPLQRERMKLLDLFEAAHHLRVVDYATLVGKSRRWISYEIQARNLLALSMGHRGLRVPDWQLDPLKRRLVQSVLASTPPDIDAWQIYHVLTEAHESLGGRSPIGAITVRNLDCLVGLVRDTLDAMQWPVSPFTTLSQGENATAVEMMV